MCYKWSPDSRTILGVGVIMGGTAEENSQIQIQEDDK
jgi:hypothetical protein